MKKPYPLLRYWRPHFRRLVEQFRRNGESDWAACKRLRPALVKEVDKRWTENYLVQVFQGDLAPSRRFKIAVEKLYARKGKPRRDRPRLYVPFPTRREIKYIEKHLTPDDRREILLAAASHEDFE